MLLMFAHQQTQALFKISLSEGWKSRKQGPGKLPGPSLCSSEKKTPTSFFSQQPVKHQTVQKWSERTNPLVRKTRDKVVLAVSIFKTSFLGLMTGCGKNKENKKWKIMITARGFHVVALPAPVESTFRVCSQKLILRLIPPRQWHHWTRASSKNSAWLQIIIPVWD